MESKALENSQNTENNISSWGAHLATIGISTIGGAVLGGFKGGILGAATSIVDEYLINNNYTNKHYLTTTSFWGIFSYQTFTSKLAAKFLSSYSGYGSIAATVAAAPAISYLTDDFLNFENQIDLPIESFSMINRLFDHNQVISSKELSKIYNLAFEDPKAAISLINHDISELSQNSFFTNFLISNIINIAHIYVDFFLLEKLGHNTKGLFAHAFLRNTSPEDTTYPILGVPKSVFSDAGYICGLFIAKKLLNLGVEATQQYIIAKQYDMALEKINDLVLENGNGKRLEVSVKGKDHLKNLDYDIYVSLDKGISKLNEFFKSSAKALFALGKIYNLDPVTNKVYNADTLIPYLSIFIPGQKILEWISSSLKNNTEKLTDVDNKLWNIKSHIIHSIEQIDLRDGEEFIKHKYHEHMTEKSSLLLWNSILTKIIDALYIVPKNLYALIEVIYFWNKATAMGMTIEDLVKDLPIIHEANLDLLDFFNNNYYSEFNHKELIGAQNRIAELLEIMADTKNDQVIRTNNDQDKLIFKDYHLILNGKELVNIDHFEFDAGKHYAITGKSGCGKTSTLINFKEGISGSLTSSGEISVPYKNGQPAKVMFIDQKLYLPTDSTLLESVYFPHLLDDLTEVQKALFRAQVIELFREFSIDEFVNDPIHFDKGLISKLDSKEFKLSGGQTKKIAIMQAIFNNPDILILDETFTGLDKKSLIQMEALINKYLPNTMILSVDHHAEDNNYNGFYDYEANFANTTVSLLDLPIKEIDIPISLETSMVNNIFELNFIGDTVPQAELFGLST